MESMTDRLIRSLIATELCWHLSYFQSLEADPEFPDMTPEDHFCCSIITSYEDEVKGWGPDAETAMLNAISGHGEPLDLSAIV